MDASARPYFIHHRNQVGLNSVLMELFRWIDLFLQSDEAAREPLNALRLISDYLQQHHFVAPLPSEGLVDMYDESKVQPNTTSDAPFVDLARLLASIPRVGQSNTHSAEHPAPTPARTSEAATNVQLEPLRTSAALSASGLRSPDGSFVHVTWPPKDPPPKEKTRQRRNSIRFLTRKDEIKEDEGNYTDLVRNKLTLWLSRPDIRALKTRVKQALNKQSCVPKPDHVFAPQFMSPATSIVGEPQSATTNLYTASSRRSRRPSITDPEARPQIIRLDPVQVSKNVVTQGDATPPAGRKRAQSFSVAKNLPQPPPPEVVKTSEPATIGPSRESSKKLRRTAGTIKDNDKVSNISHDHTLEEASSLASPATTAPYARPPVLPLALHHRSRAGPSGQSDAGHKQSRPEIPTAALTDFERKHKPRRRVLAPEVPIIEATDRSPGITVQRPSMVAPLISPYDLDLSEMNISSPTHDSISSPDVSRPHGRKEVAIYDPPMRSRTSRGQYTSATRGQRPTHAPSSHMTVSSTQNTTTVYRIELEDLPHFSQASIDGSGLMPDFGVFPSPTYDESETRLSPRERETIIQKTGIRQGEAYAPPRLALDTQNYSSAYGQGPASSSLLYSAGEYSAYPLMDYPTPNSHRSSSLRSVKRKDVPAYDPRTGETFDQREQPRPERASPADARRMNLTGDYIPTERNRRSVQSVDQVNQSRFSLDSDFSGQTHSASESSHRLRPSKHTRRDSASTFGAVSSSGEAMSQEGEWMANLAARRRPFIRSGNTQRNPSRRTRERTGEMEGLPEEQVDEESRNPRHATISLPVQHRPQSRELTRAAIHQSWQGRGKEVYAGF